MGYFLGEIKLSDFDIYVFILCLFVFVSLTALFSVMLHVLLSQGYKAIKHGLEDERIKTEYLKHINRKKLPVSRVKPGRLWALTTSIVEAMLATTTAY